MSGVVIDTNVLLVANEQHKAVTPECITACISLLNGLTERQDTRQIVIDDSFLILSEYLNKTKPNQPKGVGDVFLKWLLRVQGDNNIVCAVTCNDTCHSEVIKQVDIADQKFIHAAYAYSEHVSIVQATDCKWLNWSQELTKECSNIVVEYICRSDICKFYRTTFPNAKCPFLCDEI